MKWVSENGFCGGRFFPQKLSKGMMVDEVRGESGNVEKSLRKQRLNSGVPSGLYARAWTLAKFEKKRRHRRILTVAGECELTLSELSVHVFSLHFGFGPLSLVEQKDQQIRVLERTQKPWA